MALKDFDQLVTEIDTAVHPNGPQGKTTALSLGTVLKSLAKELTTLPQEAAVAATHKADLDASGRVPSSQLPSYVDDVVESASFAVLPASGEAGKIYVTVDTNTVYRWSGAQYVEITRSPMVLYPTTGQNTDGAMTQKAVTDVVGGIIDLTTNKAILVKADRSKVYYTGNGTAAKSNADDAVVLAFANAAPGDYVYITAPVNMPNAGFYAPLCAIKGGSNVNLGGFPITTINRQDAIGISMPGTGIVYGYGSVLTAVGPGSYGVNVTAGAVGANYRFLNVNFRGTGPGSGILVRGGDYYQEGFIEILGSGYGVVIVGAGSFSHQVVGDISLAGSGKAFYVESASRAVLRRGHIALLTATASLGELRNTATLEVERSTIDLTLRPLDGGITCFESGVKITLTDTTVIGGSLIKVGNGATLVLRGSTTLPTEYDANYLRSKGMNVLDQRPTQSVAHRTATTLTFEQDAEYDPIATGTFSVDDSTKRIGAVVVVYLTPTAAAPTLPAPNFQSKDGYVTGKNLMYQFKVGANGAIQYTITVLD